MYEVRQPKDCEPPKIRPRLLAIVTTGYFGDLAATAYAGVTSASHRRQTAVVVALLL
jgi:hypothetical protein